MKQLGVSRTNILYAIYLALYIVLSYLGAALLPGNAPFALRMMVSEIVSALIIVGYLFVLKINPLNLLRFARISLGDVILIFIGTIALMPTMYFLNFISMLFAQNHMNSLALKIMQYPMWARFILMAIIPAVIEEFCFRGFFYSGVRQRNLIWGALTTGLFFGFAHLNLNQFFYAFFMGTVFCVVYEITDNFFMPVLMHCTINGISTLLTGANTQQLETTVNNEITLTSIPVASLVIAGAIILSFTIVGFAIFVALIKKVAIRHNKNMIIKESIEEIKSNNYKCDEKIFDWVLTVTIIATFAYMIVNEFVL